MGRWLWRARVCARRGSGDLFESLSLDLEILLGSHGAPNCYETARHGGRIYLLMNQMAPLRCIFLWQKSENLLSLTFIAFQGNGQGESRHRRRASEDGKTTTSLVPVCPNMESAVL